MLAWVSAPPCLRGQGRSSSRAVVGLVIGMCACTETTTAAADVTTAKTMQKHTCN